MGTDLDAHRTLDEHARWGLFTRADALAAGFSEKQIRTRLRRGEWRRVLGTALARSGSTVDDWVRAQAVPLTWPDAVVCLGAAARLYGLPVDAPALVDVVVPTPRPPRFGLDTHTYPLDASDVNPWGDAVVTTRSRTIVDCLGRLPADDALDLAAWVHSRRLLTADELDAWLDAHPRAWGNRQRARMAQRLRAGRLSAAEDLLHQLLRGARVRGWVAGASLLEHVGVAAEADAYFPDVRLVIEVDGRRAHGSAAFQSDRTRQNRLVAAGCTVLRFTWDDLTRHPTEVLATIRATRARLVARAA